MPSREEYIRSVKVQLEEVSAFEEPDTFLATDVNDTFTSDDRHIKPLRTYIDKSLDRATWYCLSVIPSKLLRQDIRLLNPIIHIDDKGVGSCDFQCEHYRPIRFWGGDKWRRDVVNFPTEQSPEYLLQSNFYTRGGTNKPRIFIDTINGLLEFYSFHETNTSFEGELYCVDLQTLPQDVSSPIEHFIVLKSAQYVLEMFNDTPRAQLLEKTFNDKLQVIS